MLPRFFMDRPIFAAVLSILITLCGALTAFTLPISQYPPVTPPTIQVDCAYPGSSSKIVSETIAAPIEQRVNGVERMLYMTSQSTADGSYTLTIAFEPGTNLDMAQVMVQNRVNLALPELPEVVRATGVTTRKRSPEILLTISVNSPDGRYDQLYLSNYALTHIKDDLSRIEGISDVTIFGQRDYSMRIHLDPNRLTSRGLTALDVVNSVRAQNLQVSLGQLGGPETPTSIPLTIVGRLRDEEDFGNIVIKSSDHGLIRIRDVARVELNARAQDVENRFDNKATIGLAIFLLSDANALEAAEEIKRRMANLAQDFPPGIIYEIGYDTTPFMRESIREVFKALRDSVILVALVVLVFLQSWRATIIPLLAVPTAIVGTFAAMWCVGFGLNNLTLFGLVLSVGIVVDDAIVVVEAVQHQLEKGFSPREATIRAMNDVSGPIIAVGAVLVAVFVPCAFFPGIVGQFFRQFALTIAISTLISTFNSLTLSPALAALLLKPPTEKQDWPSRGLNFLFGWFFRYFNAGFRLAGVGYVKLVSGLIRVPVIVLILYVAALGATQRGYLMLPSGFIPQQDKGFLIASIQLPDAASAERTRQTIQEITTIVKSVPGVAHVNSVAGNSFVLSAYGSNFGSMFIILDPFEERTTPELYSEAIIKKIRDKVSANITEAQVNVFGAPAVPGLGRAGGFRMMVEDRGVEDFKVLQGMTDELVANGNKQPGLAGLFTVFKVNSPQLSVEVNPAACSSEGIDIRDVYAVMQATLGARYINDFNRFGRTWQVNVQADPRFRDDLASVRNLKIKNKSGLLVPLSAVAKISETEGPLVLTRYNMYPAAAINGNIAPGTSSGAGLATLKALADRELPQNMKTEWTELAFIEERSRDTGMSVFAIAVAVVFLVLAFLYESWATPLAVILVVPMCVSCSLLGVYIAKQDVNIFTQVGFVVLIGLACKNAILIVEFAKRQRDAGVDRRTAILEACHLRLRPILMTSAAFILGVVPLVLATGAGAEMRRALGVAVFSGMLGVTLFGILLTPVFYILVDRITHRQPDDVSWWRQAVNGVWYLVSFKFLRDSIRFSRLGRRTSQPIPG
jgi:hydrophobe/amphiphile efflux-1 (HAE1) family protein